MLPRPSVLLLLLALAAAAGWASLDRLAEGELRRQLARRGLAGLADHGQLALDLPDTAVLTGVTLRDPLDGRLIGELDELVFRLERDPGGDPPLVLGGVWGRGARIVLVPDETEYALGIVRGLDRLISAIVELVDELTGPDEPGAEPLPLPPLEFRDIDLTVRCPGRPLEHYPGSRVFIDDDETGYLVIARIFIGEDLGELRLTFHADDGLVRISAHDLVVSTTITQLIPEPWGSLLARTFRPSGRIDFVLEGFAEDQELSLRGELHEAVLRPAAVALPVGPATFPFSMKDGRLRVERVAVPYAGGTVEVTALGTEDVVDIELSVRGADLSGAVSMLVPDGAGAGDLPVALSEAGRFDTDLTLQGSLSRGLSVVGGSGGFHVESVTLTELGVTLEDVVGRFAVRDDVIDVDRLSALCAGGGLRGAVTVDLVERTLRGDVDLLDIDIARLRPPDPEGPTGWLQGAVSVQGRLDALHDLASEGQLSLRAGRFAEAPLVAELGAALAGALGEDRRPRDEQRVALHFEGVGDTFLLDKLRLDIGALVLAGTGRLEGDRRLALDLYLISREGLISQIVSLVGEALVQVAVRGTLQEPRVNTYLGAVVTRPLAALLSSLVLWE